ncbi:MAG TPA: hypothetical protein VNR65_16645 [Geobacterales bacterium]|nr:hypothetical protein [Geobacterales bacterium]
MKLISELKLKLFADEMRRQARRIQTLDGQVNVKIPVAALGGSILSGPQLVGKNLAEYWLEAREMFRDDGAKVEYSL